MRRLLVEAEAAPAFDRLTPSESLEYSPGAMAAIVVVTSVGTEDEANQLARELVVRRQAACVNILPGVRSVYRWQGGVTTDTELLLVIKTLEPEFDAVVASIHEISSYELPEILSFKVARGDRAFLDWIASSVDKSAALAAEEEDELVDFGDLDDTNY